MITVSDYMEFKGKTLDLAISEACTYFGVNREKLEIEIISDAKSGIFGLVGAKKATVKARRMRIDSGENLAPREAKAAEVEAKSSERRGSERRKPRQERESGHKGRLQGSDDAPYSGSVSEAASNAIARPASEAFGPFGLESEDVVETAPRSRSESITESRPESRPESRRDRQPREERPEKTPRRTSDRSSDRLARSRDSRDARDSSGATASSENSTRRSQDNRDRKPAQPVGEGRNPGRGSRTHENDATQPRSAGERPSPERHERQGRVASGPRSTRGRSSDKFAAPQMASPQMPEDMVAGEEIPLLEDEVCNDGFAPLNIESVGADKVIEETSRVILRLVESIVDNPTCEVEITPDSRIKVMIDAGDSSGLLIGRYSQTLTAIQYIASRILSRIFGAAARMQIDAGDYRERQDGKMRELALSLAERVKEEGRGLYTRPLSSYHRRVVHVTLQDDPELQTRSKGDGAMKRVLITLKRR